MKRLSLLNQPDSYYKDLFDRLNQGYILVEVLFDKDDNPVDIYYIEANAAAERMTGTKLAGKRTRELDPNYEQHWFDIFGRVAKTGVPEQHEVTAAPLNVYYQFYAFKVGAPEERKIAVIYQDVTERKQAEISLRDSESRLKTVLDEVAEAFYVLDDQLHFVFASKAALAMWNKKQEEVFGHQFLNAFPQAEGSASYEAHLRVLQTGITERFEIVSPVLDHWIEIKIATNEQGGLSVAFWDIEDRKQAEKKLEESEEKYRTLFDSIDEGVTLFDAVFDEHGRMVDARYVETNPAAFRLTGLPPDFVGKLVSEVIPDLEQFWFDTYERVVKTGQPERFENLVGGLNRWFDVYVSRVGGEGSRRLATVYNNITERKHSEAALLSSEKRLSAIANLVPDLLWESEADGSTTWYNDRWLGYTGQKIEAAIGWGWLDVIHPDDREGSERRYREAIKTGEPLQQEHRIRRHDGQYRWFVVKTLPVTGPDGEVTKMYGAATDIHDRKEAEDLLRESETKFRTLFETIGEGFTILETVRADQGRLIDLIYKDANAAYFKHTGFQPTPGLRIKEVAPDIEDEWMDFYDRVSRTGVSEQKESYNADLNRWFRTNASRIGGDVSPLLGIVVEDTTERNLASKVLRGNEQRQQFLLKLSDTLRPLTDPRAIISKAMQLMGSHLQVNRAAYVDAETEPDQMRVISDYTFDVEPWVGSINLADFGAALGKDYLEGKTVVIGDVQSDERFADSRDVYRALEIGAAVGVPLFKDGHIVAAMGVHNNKPRNWTNTDISIIEEVAERTWSAVERARAEDALKDYNIRLEREVADRTHQLEDNQRLLRTIIDSSFTFIQVFKAIRDDAGEITDFKWLTVNKRFAETYGEMTGRSLLAQNPAVIETGIFADMTRATETGEQIEEEHYYKHEQFDGWFYQILVKMDDGVIMTTADITDRKRNELQLKENRDRLQSVLDTTLVQMSILKAERDEHGEITDFRIELVNKELEQATGRSDLVGKLYAAEYPGIRQAGVFDMVVKTVESGEPQQLEYFYHYEGFNHWFSSMFVKLEDGVVSTNMDITARKQAEDERFRNFLLLQQSEDLAQTGSWDFDLLTGAFSWSDGMYRLFDLKRGIEVKPEVYLKYATKDSLPAAERVVKHTKSGDADFEETLEISVGGKLKVLHLKATVVRNDAGHAVRVLGVDMDITAMRAAEQKIRQMEAEQQLEVFRVTLSTLEEERHRISESLHNGIGQILYGIKLSLGNIKQHAEPEVFTKAKNYTGELLTDAIVETRRISHELMPTTLDQFGLKQAIDDVCEQLSDGVQFTCYLRGTTSHLEKYLQLAVYRTVQELMTNVVKHAKATQATADIEIEREVITITVTDNGSGIDASKKSKPGIGLASIRSKIALLNGGVIIDSEPGNGTAVMVKIPIPARST